MKVDSISMMPVENIWAVYDNNGEQIKEKVFGVIALHMPEEKAVTFKIVTLLNLKEGFIDCSEEGHCFASNFLGLVDNEGETIDL